MAGFKTPRIWIESAVIHFPGVLEAEAMPSFFFFFHSFWSRLHDQAAFFEHLLNLEALD